MEEDAVPLPTLRGEGEPSHHNIRRWLLASLGSFGGWILLWSVLVWGISSHFLNDKRLWLSITLLGLLLLASLAAFPPLLAGMMHFRIRQGKIVFWVSFLHALFVIVSTALMAYAITQDK